MTEENSLTFIFENLGITDDSTRSSAKKSKAKSDVHQCAVCFFLFETHKKMGTHLKKHKAEAKQIKLDFDEAKKAFSNNHEDKIAAFNYRIALAKVTVLENFGRARK